MPRRSTRLSTGSVLPKSYASSSEGELESEDDNAQVENTAVQSETSEEEASSDSELGYGEKPSRAQIAKRRNESRKANSAARNAKWLSTIYKDGRAMYPYFLDFPYEILMQILSLLSPEVLYALSLTNKAWYDRLWSRQQSELLWRKSFERLTFDWENESRPVPTPPAGFCLPFYARFLFIDVCMACNVYSFYRPTTKFMRHLVTLCRKCADVLFITKQSTIQHLAAYGKPLENNRIFKVCLSDRPKGARVYYWWEVQSTLKKLEQEKYQNVDSKSFKRLIAKTQDLHERRNAFAQAVTQWLQFRNLWLKHEQTQAVIREKQQMRDLIAKVIQRIQLYDNEDLAHALQVYIEQDCMDFSRQCWLKLAKLEAEREEPEIAVESWKCIHSRLIQTFETFYDTQVQLVRHWQEEESIRALMKPWFVALQTTHQKDYRVWPVFYAFLRLNSCSVLREQFRNRDPPASAAEIDQSLNDIKDTILNEIRRLSGNPPNTDYLNAIDRLLTCRCCGADYLTIHDLHSHACFIYSYKTAKKWRPDRVVVGNTVSLVDKAPIILTEGDEESYICRVTPLGLHLSFNYPRSQYAVQAMLQIIHTIPATHSAAITKIFKCVTCKNRGLQDHTASDYRAILKLYITYFKGLSAPAFEFMKLRMNVGLRSNRFYAAEFTNNHLEWREVANADEELELSDSDSEDDQDSDDGW